MTVHASRPPPAWMFALAAAVYAFSQRTVYLLEAVPISGHELADEFSQP